MSSPQLPVVLLMGPTGAGKTELSFTLAGRFPLELVSVDSAMVYRGMDIGTAKPSAAERARVPHHLIDIRDPAQAYSAGQFVRDARQAIDAILRAGKLPLLVGGTMLYFHALLHGLARLPEGDPDLRARIDAEAQRVGWAALHAELARIDPQAAARIHVNDPQRIQRALEVYRATGVPITSLQRQRRAALEGLRTVKLVLDVPDRAELHERIERRFHAMMRAGFLEEVRALRRRGDLHPRVPALRAVGYRQLWSHLSGEHTLEEAMQDALRATRQLAKRQLTWLRAIKGAHWIEARATDAARRAEDLVRTVAGSNSSGRVEGLC
jgi:tRNA dimethylallyltransferase